MDASDCSLSGVFFASDPCEFGAAFATGVVVLGLAFGAAFGAALFPLVLFFAPFVAFLVAIFFAFLAFGAAFDAALSPLVLFFTAFVLVVFFFAFLDFLFPFVPLGGGGRTTPTASSSSSVVSIVSTVSVLFLFFFPFLSLDIAIKGIKEWLADEKKRSTVTVFKSVDLTPN